MPPCEIKPSGRRFVLLATSGLLLGGGERQPTDVVVVVFGQAYGKSVFELLT